MTYLMCLEENGLALVDPKNLFRQGQIKGTAAEQRERERERQKTEEREEQSTTENNRASWKEKNGIDIGLEEIFLHRLCRGKEL